MKKEREASMRAGKAPFHGHLAEQLRGGQGNLHLYLAERV